MPATLHLGKLFTSNIHKQLLLAYNTERLKVNTVLFTFAPLN